MRAPIRLPPLSPITAWRVASVLAVGWQVAKAARRSAPLAPPTPPHLASNGSARLASTESTESNGSAQLASTDSTESSRRISVVIPARDEATRIEPLLAAIVGAPGVCEVIVVDDQSHDDTAGIARQHGAHVIGGTPLPSGWAGKCWALQQGITAANGEWVVTLDADTRPDPLLAAALVLRAEADQLDFVTVGGRFDCPTAPAQWLHAAMLTTLVYRFGPPGVVSGPSTAMANGQCMAFRRTPFIAAGGFAPIAHHLVEDVALVRHLAAAGWRTAMLDATDLLTVRMYESLTDTWHGWGRSIALPGVEPCWRQVAHVGALVAAQLLPLPRLLSRKGDILDLAMLTMRAGTLVGTAPAYQRHGAAYWLSPFADAPAVIRLVASLARPSTTWRGRSYPPSETAGR